MEKGSSPESEPFGVEGSAGLPNLPEPAVFGIGESMKHRFRVFQVCRFQNWY